MVHACITRLVAAILGALAGFSGAPAGAQTGGDFYRGKTLRMVVGYGPGGGYDIYARLIAPAIGKALGALVIVENMPGAGGLVALNRMYAATPDGLSFMIVNGTGAGLSQLMELSSVRYDLARVSHLGTVSASPWVWIMGSSTSIRTPAEAVAAKGVFMWSGSGPIDGTSDGAAFTCEALKLKCRIVLGYAGSNDAALAVTKGEMDAIYTSDTSANIYARDGGNRAIAVMGRARSRFFPELPTIFEQVKLDEEQCWLFDFRSTADDLGRILVAPPGVPAPVLAQLQAAVKTALTDPAMIADGERTQRYIDFVDAQKTAASLDRIARITPEQRRKVRDIIATAEQK